LLRGSLVGGREGGREFEEVHGVNWDGGCRSVGYYTAAENPSKRLAMPLVFVKGDSTCSLENAYARPVDGLWIVFESPKNGTHSH